MVKLSSTGFRVLLGGCVMWTLAGMSADGIWTNRATGVWSDAANWADGTVAGWRRCSDVSRSFWLLQHHKRRGDHHPLQNARQSGFNTRFASH